ncbi:CheY chemotaxis protein or a CheY-like REC (receiver) domain [Filimonas lacunae]|uniref:CheY chemotaxis protein or a CheY-like REC (Receiver) domain n=1 Tax=Filimonas lacunae TaxID=477680 RepID=A0A1N7R5M1_9BACT|nr:response regulator [Filimonas lacunae]SIT30411.1 CheY chemotaxis protein or a CheY-like REC (receiver) domain [Filimonas lacunae]
MEKRNIIIVENDVDEQLLMREGFEKSGYFNLLAPFNNGNDLLYWLNANPDVIPDVILSDLNMPGKNGYDIMVNLQKIAAYAEVPFFIMSTLSNPVLVQICLSRGAAGFLVKPRVYIDYTTFACQLNALVLQNVWQKQGVGVV